jgi:hypothetical protein
MAQVGATTTIISARDYNTIHSAIADHFGAKKNDVRIVFDPAYIPLVGHPAKPGEVYVCGQLIAGYAVKASARHYKLVKAAGDIA